MATWIKLQDNFWRNPKVLAAGEDAATLYVQGLCYCSDSETDGKIPTAALRMLTAKKDCRTLARILVREGLWTETAHGWEVHDYLVHQRSKAQIEAEREATRARVARHRSRTSNTVTNAVTSGDVTEPDTETDTDTDTDLGQPRCATPINGHALELAIPQAPAPPDPFDEFWAVYPLRRSKGAARKAWAKAVKKVPAERLIAAAQDYAQNDQKVADGYIQLPATWLNGEGWDNEPAATRPRISKSTQALAAWAERTS